MMYWKWKNDHFRPYIILKTFLLSILKSFFTWFYHMILTRRYLIRSLPPIFAVSVYRVGSQYGWSSIFSFVGLKERPGGGYKSEFLSEKLKIQKLFVRFAVFGDMGNVNARSLGKLQREAQNGRKVLVKIFWTTFSGDFDMVLHNGRNSKIKHWLFWKIILKFRWFGLQPGHGILLFYGIFWVLHMYCSLLQVF